MQNNGKEEDRSMTTMTTIELDPTYTEEVTPDEFIRMFIDEQDKIDFAQIVPPQLGKKGFGNILVVRKFAVYKPKKDKSPLQ
ncbi:MAG: hypothetical protein AB7P14_13260 [Blastocatellales bacterium]